MRTHLRVLLYDIANLPAGNMLTPLDVRNVIGTHTSFGAGMDSVVVTDDSAAILNRNDAVTRVRIYDISNDSLRLHICSAN